MSFPRIARVFSHAPYRASRSCLIMILSRIAEKTLKQKALKQHVLPRIVGEHSNMIPLPSSRRKLSNKKPSNKHVLPRIVRRALKHDPSLHRGENSQTKSPQTTCPSSHRGRALKHDPSPALRGRVREGAARPAHRLHPTRSATA